MNVEKCVAPEGLEPSVFSLRGSSFTNSATRPKFSAPTGIRTLPLGLKDQCAGLLSDTQTTNTMEAYINVDNSTKFNFFCTDCFHRWVHHPTCFCFFIILILYNVREHGEIRTPDQRLRRPMFFR